MGDAKRRKAVDPSYGRPKRGLIISPPMEIAGTRLSVKTAAIDKQELRFSLLFWDRLVWPSSRAFHIGSGPDELYLESIGVLNRPDYTFNGDVAAGMAAGYVKAFQDLNQKAPGQWAMAHGENSLILSGVRMPPDESTVVEIHRAIPVPDKDVPLEDLLSFKHKRHDELINLRNHLDGFVAAANAASDKVSELNRLTAEVDAACAEVLRVSKEWKFPVRLSSLKTSVKLRPFQTLAGAMGGVGLGHMQSLPHSGQVMASILGATVATAPALEISADMGWRGLRNAQSPFLYVSSFHREVF